MQSPKPVRTYLDADAVGPLPRFSYADDSDALSAQRTIERSPTKTVELAPEDVLEIFDPKRPRRPSSIAPVGYDTAILRPRRRLGNLVFGVVTTACVLVGVAAIHGRSRPDDKAPPAAATSKAMAAGAALDPPGAAASAVAPPLAASASSASVAPSSPANNDATVGTLRVDPQAEGHRVWVDGVVLTAEAALVRCGEHHVKVGSAGRTRTIDVPCGGEITVFR